MLDKATTILFISLSLVSTVCYSSKLCFTYAQTDYEQLYCEIKAKGKGASLPSLYEFQRNNAITQALLLKRHARDIGVNVVMPTVKNTKTASSRALKPKTQLAKLTPTTNNSPQELGVLTSVDNLSQCHSDKSVIRCEKHTYALIGNQANTTLDSGVFEKKDTMDLPVYTGSINNKQSLDNYLLTSYTHYLKKMLSIGLGASTLSFGKFSYLFNDLYQKKINFSKRFETMYFYLKQDKQRMAVNAQVIPPNSLSLNDCYHLESMLVCTAGKKNYLYLLVNQ